MKAKVLKEEPVSLAEVKVLLERVKEKEGELSFRAQKTAEYLEQFALLGEKKAKDLYKKLEELGVPRLKDVHYYKLIDTLPNTQKDVKVVLQGFAVTVTPENTKKIADVIAENV